MVLDENLYTKTRPFNGRRQWIISRLLAELHIQFISTTSLTVRSPEEARLDTGIGPHQTVRSPEQVRLYTGSDLT